MNGYIFSIYIYIYIYQYEICNHSQNQTKCMLLSLDSKYILHISLPNIVHICLLLVVFVCSTVCIYYEFVTVIDNVYASLSILSHQKLYRSFSLRQILEQISETFLFFLYDKDFFY